MVHPRAKKGQRRPSMIGDIFLFVGAAASFATLLSIFGPTIYLVDQHHEVSKDIRAPISRDPVVSKSEQQQQTRVDDLNVEVDVEDLPHEDMFNATIKSCMPIKNKKCKQFIPEPIGNDKKKVQRVALIAPPGDISKSLLHRIEEVLHHHNHERQNKVDLDIEVIERTHVPPYGYGKTHGLTKVLRLVPQPLVLEVTDALQALLEPGETHAIITLDDVKVAQRQIIRFHCRLSHLGAHTALLSVGFMDMLAAPGEILHNLQSFLVPKDIPEKHDGDDDLQFAPDDDQEGLFQAQEVWGSNILTHLQSVSQQDVNKVLDQVLLDEMKLSKNLTAWPCQSFWTAGEAPDPTKLSPLTQRLARALSPDCDDPYASCFVKRDKCEAKGDGLCKG